MRMPALAIAASLILWAGAATAARGQDLFSPFMFLGLGGEPPADASLLKNTGMAAQRLVVSWQQIEGRGMANRWQETDAKAYAVSDAGMLLELVLNLTWGAGPQPSFAIDPDTRLPGDAAGRQAMLDFVSEAAGRYRSFAASFVLENDLSAAGFPGGPRVYADLLRSVSAILRRTAPEAKILIGPLCFDTLEEDRRVFYVADILSDLPGGVFDGLQLRVIGRDPLEDFQRIEAGYLHARGQLSGTPYANAPVVLLTSSPSGGAHATWEDEQAGDYVRRAILCGVIGAAGMYWDAGLIWQPPPGWALDAFTGNLQDASLAGRAGADGRPYFKKAFYTARVMGTIVRRFDLHDLKIKDHGRGIYEAKMYNRAAERLFFAWRDPFISGESFGSSVNLELKQFGFEGPGRQGLYSLRLTPVGQDRFSMWLLSDLTFYLDGSPVVLSQKADMLREWIGLGPESYAPSPGFSNPPSDTAPF